MKTMKTLLRLCYYRSGFFRNLANLIYWLTHYKNGFGIGHLVLMREEDANGPIQRDEALFLFAIIRVVRPKNIVEFGFHGGRSAFNFLCALSNGGGIYIPTTLAPAHNR